MQVERRAIESNLPRKGFVEEPDKHHRYFHHEYRGRRTGKYTFTSHGSNFKTYGPTLLKKMTLQLGLDTTKQVFDLCKCPMDEDEYNRVLDSKGFLSE